MKLSRQIMLCFTVPLLVLLALMGLCTLGVIIPSVVSWGGRVKELVKEEEVENLNTRAYNLKNLASQAMGQVINDVLLQKDYAIALFNGGLPVKSFYSSFYITDKYYMEDEEASVWFNKLSSDPEDNLYLNISSAMDNVWRAIFRANDKYAGMYIGFEDKMYRYYPHSDLTSYPEKIISCDGVNVVGYDPTCRTWYERSEENRYDVTFTEPYEDVLTGDILISASHAVHGYGNFIGVVAVDVSLNGLDSIILSEKVLNHGYAYLVDNQGILLSYPGLSYEETVYVWDAELKNSYENSMFKESFLEMVENEEESIDYEKNGEDWTSIVGKVEGTNYYVVLAVPYSDIYESVEKINTLMQVVIIVACVVMVALTIIMIIISVPLNIKSASRITEPMEHLNKVTTEIKNDNLDVELHDVKTTSPELGNIFDHYHYLIKAVRFANKDYAAGNVKKAYDNYIEILDMMKEIKNLRGEGIVYNNLGLVLREFEVENNLDQAEKYLVKSIQNARKMQSEKPEEKDYFIRTEANREMNLGLIYKSMGKKKEAIERYLKCIKLYENQEKQTGKIQALGNLGTLYLENGENENGFKYLKEAYDLANLQCSKSLDQKNADLSQFSALNLANFYLKQEKPKSALPLLIFAISLQERIDKNFLNLCLSNLRNAYKMLGEIEFVKKINIHLQEEKNVIFCLDVSGSMAGSLIRSCRESINQILKEYMYIGDVVSLLTFSEKTSWVFSGVEINDYSKNNLYTQVNKNTNTGGCTAFYDAVYNCCEKLIHSTQKNNWLIALTDGEDNNSNRKASFLANYIRENKINIIIITVGNLKNINKIIEIVDASPGGIHLQVTGNSKVDGIRDAFSKAINIINRGQVSVEIL